MSFFSMTKTLLKSLFHGPYTVCYPKNNKDKIAITRGKIEITIEDCIYCGMCSRNCPTGAIKIDKSEFKWSIQRLQCIQCGYCVDTCPKKCLRMDTQYTAPSFDKVRDEYTNA